MAVFTYIARRSLLPGHDYGDPVTLLLEVTDATTRNMQDLKKTERSLNGKTETQFFAQVEKWNVQLAPLDLNAADEAREFLDSTADGQTFTFDPYSMEETTSGWSINVIRDDEGYTESRFMAIGNGGEDDYIQFEFQVRSA